MSAAPGADQSLATTPPLPEVQTRLTSPNGVTRSRDEFDADANDEGDMTSSPHPPKIARPSMEAEDIAKAGASAKEDQCEEDAQPTDPTILALIEELECGMCAGLYIDPVALNGCGHTFCGSCVVQWINSLPRFPTSLLPGDPVPDPISCPQCRHAPIQTATPSRMAKTMSGVLLQVYAGAARPPNEHSQAAALYKSSTGVLKFPIPPPAPRLNERDYWRPCRWCYTQGDGWKCPVPVPRFEVLAERPMCIRTDGFPPDGHRLCAGCERLSPANAPSSVACGICGEGFCGDAATSCDCPPVSQSKPSNQYNTLAYLLEDSPTDQLAMAFKDNWTEMYNLGVYLGANAEANKPSAIYKAILDWLRSPEGIDSGGVLGLMTRADIGIRLRTGAANEMQQAIMPVEEGAPEDKVCSTCADELLCSGLLEWWMRQLQIPEVADKMPNNIKGRPNCKFGRKCVRQDNDTHAKKCEQWFVPRLPLTPDNHICNALPVEQADKLQQDDTMPAVAAPGPNDAIPAIAPPPVAEGASDEDSDEDDDSDGGTDTDEDGVENGNNAPPAKSNYVDASAQWESNAAGTVLTVQAPPMLPVWSLNAAMISSSSGPNANASTSAHVTTTQQQPAVAISSLINSPPASDVTNAAGPSTMPSTSTSRLLTPFPQPGPRISGSASSPLAGPSFTIAPHLIFNSARRAQTPPLGVSQIGNHANASVDTAPPKLGVPIPIPKSSPTRFTFDAVGADVLAGRDEGSAMDVDS